MAGCSLACAVLRPSPLVGLFQKQYLKEPLYATYPVAFGESRLTHDLTNGLSKTHKHLAPALTPHVQHQKLSMPRPPPFWNSSYSLASAEMRTHLSTSCP